MPPRRRRGVAPRRRWPFYLLFAAGVLAGVALWAYSPSLPAETLIARYANDHSKFIDVGGVRAHVREQGNPDGIPLVLIHGAAQIRTDVAQLLRAEDQQHDDQNDHPVPDAERPHDSLLKLLG